MAQPVNLSSEIKAFLIIDAEGRQICCKYYSEEFASLEARGQLEKKLPKRSEELNEGKHGLSPMYSGNDRSSLMFSSFRHQRTSSSSTIM